MEIELAVLLKKSRKLNYWLGYISELLVILFFKKKEFFLLKHRYKNDNYEIDIIMLNRKAEEILFIEVKFRQNKSHFENYVNYNNMQKLYVSAEYFLQIHSEVFKALNITNIYSYNQSFKLCLVSPEAMKIIDIY